MTVVEDWVTKVPVDVWHILEDWGYFRQDINLTDVVNLTKYLLDSLANGDNTDYYYSLQYEDEVRYYKLRFDCITFLYCFEQYALGKGMLEE
ncbi:hypothetical protein [Bacillus atrophaeus]|uniref:hypothetical protein n=1 Tax=Bacillus atrophaeus TaxID=1452 RepID=UPI000B9272E3|nr:hypothetical protein [Bacillus atrophaeus]ASS71713.1 hypothetical protein BaGK_12465 [Bacillus atrophaeus]KAA6454965.1 hypothetical protein DX926_02675 [Bacillus atrophaeus]MDS9997155.1 hypothetical protein [Bacillus atrophaeus]MED4827709.1 hypothetical protein [Bacillus atrophaeus]PSA94144.1 hypothetical protein C6371_03595 [Bacillus atrophaeus]